MDEIRCGHCRTIHDEHPIISDPECPHCTGICASWWSDWEGNWIKCEVCHSNNAVTTAAVPAIPHTAAYCQVCLKANAHPWWLLVANTAECGGLADCASWWKDMVSATCARLNKTLEEFDTEVLAYQSNRRYG